MPVSLCMIIKNEEANLPACLGPVVDLVDEIVVVDTGSADRSREVAASLGAHVFDFTWVEDFSAARNESLRHATAPWIIWLDADDRVDEANRAKLRTVLDSLGDENAAYMMQTALVSGTSLPRLVEHLRLFRNHPEIRWRYRIHEQIRPAVAQQGAELRRVDVVIQHVGYLDAELLQRKSERNLRLLLLDHADQPNNPDLLFHLGKHYFGHEDAKALFYLQRCLLFARRDDPSVASLYVLLGRTLRRLGRNQEALAIYCQGLERYPGDVELLSDQGYLRCVLHDFVGAEACLGQVVHRRAATDPSLLSKAHYNLGLLYHQQGRWAEAESQYRAALALDPAYADARNNLAALHAQLGGGTGGPPS
ncbi:MAG TPA: glycosyltransferase [Gemmataceae bacterium]|nr:glycosyltransferase [Gemmataceae bacterium]